MRMIFILLVMFAGLHTTLAPAHEGGAMNAHATIAMSTGMHAPSAAHLPVRDCCSGEKAGIAADCVMTCAFVPETLTFAFVKALPVPALPPAKRALPSRLFPPFRPPV